MKTSTIMIIMIIIITIIFIIVIVVPAARRSEQPPQHASQPLQILPHRPFRGRPPDVRQGDGLREIYQIGAPAVPSVERHEDVRDAYRAVGDARAVVLGEGPGDGRGRAQAGSDLVPRQRHDLPPIARVATMMSSSFLLLCAEPFLEGYALVLGSGGDGNVGAEG